MSEPTTAPAQAQAAPEPVLETPGPTLQEVSADLSMARVTHAPAAEIARLESQLAALRQPAPETPAPEPEPAEPVVEAVEPTEPIAEVIEPPAEPEAGVEPPEGEQSRFRFSDAEDRAVAAIAKAKGITLVEAARLFAGEPAQPITVEPEPLPASITDLQTQVAAMEAQLEAFPEGQWNSEIAKLTAAHARAVGKLEAQTAAHEIRAQAEADGATARQAILGEVCREYPDLQNADSALWIMANGLSKNLQAKGDPRGRDVRHCAAEAAKALKIAPVGKAAPVARATTPAPPVKPAPGPASGSRASTPPPPDKSAADQRAESEAHLQAVQEGRAKARLLQRQQPVVFL